MIFGEEMRVRPARRSASAAVFLMEKGYAIETDDGVLYKFVLAIAAGEIDEDGATRFLRDHSVTYPG
jgi:death on curing protein